MSVDTSDPGFVKNYAVQMGSKGANVLRVQELLHDVWGETSLAIDGDFGPQTDGAVRDFQRANSLAVDGVVGPMTSKALQDPASNDAAGTSALPIIVDVQPPAKRSPLKTAALVVGIPAAGYGGYRLGKHLRWW
jgi:peptidoglycan hydrolase-like protein with peptidoglycan-binding domain